MHDKFAEKYSKSIDPYGKKPHFWLTEQPYKMNNNNLKSEKRTKKKEWNIYRLLLSMHFIGEVFDGWRIENAKRVLYSCCIGVLLDGLDPKSRKISVSPRKSANVFKFRLLFSVFALFCFILYPFDGFTFQFECITIDDSLLIVECFEFHTRRDACTHSDVIGIVVGFIYSVDFDWKVEQSTFAGETHIQRESERTAEIRK